MLKRIRFSIRTLLLVAAFVAVAITVLPRLWWRYQVNQAMNTTLEYGPGFELDWQSDEFEFLASDLQRVFQQLMETFESDQSVHRRANAVHTMQLLAARAHSGSLRAEYLPQLIEIACDSKHANVPEQTFETIAAWIPSTGITEEQRLLIRQHAAKANSNPASWTKLLSAIGGQEEIVLLLKLFDGLTSDEKQKICNSSIKNLTWNEFLPHVERWMRDPSVAAIVVGEFGFSILSQTKHGRSALLDFIADANQATEIRILATEQLQSTVAGIDMLRRACENQEFSVELSALLGTGFHSTLILSRNSAKQRNGKEFWDELIDAVDEDNWFQTAGRRYPIEVEGKYRDLARRKARISLDLVRLISGVSNLETREDCQRWRDSNQPGIVAQREFLQFAIERPEFLDCNALLGRMVPYNLGDIPADCLPLYEKMLRSDVPALQYWSCRALLTYTDSTDAIDVAIDLIEKSKPSETAMTQSGEILLLKERFAVNYFWDVKAWREWALKYKNAIKK